MSGSTQAGRGPEYGVQLTEPEINYLRRLVQNAICIGAHGHALFEQEGGPPRKRPEIAHLMGLEEKLKDAWRATEAPRPTCPTAVPGDLETALGVPRSGEE